MTCPRCGTENAAGNRFCMKCGADMTATAPVEASAAGATGSGFGYTPQSTMSGDPAPGTQERYGSGYAPGSNGYNAAPPQFAPNPAGYGPGPNAGMVDQARLVGFWPRVGAYLIDAILLGIIGNIIGAVIHTNQLTTSNTISFILGLIYFGYFWTQRGGQTLGMMALKIRVVREDGQPISWGTAIIRYIMLIVSFAVIFLGVLWVIWDSKKQGWHDKAAGTLVVRA